MKLRSSLYVLGAVVLLSACKSTEITSRKAYPFQLGDNGEEVFTPGTDGGSSTMKQFHDAVNLKLKGDLVEATQSFEKIIKDNPSIAAAHYELGKLRLEKREMELAAHSAQTAIKLEPENVWYLKLAAETAALEGKYDDALGYYEKMSELAPDDMDHLFDLAFMYQKTKNYKKALEVLNNVESKVGPNEEMSAEKQKLYLLLDDIDGALAEVEKWIEREPTNPKFYTMLARLHQANNDEEGAVQAYERMLKIDPNDPYAKLMLASFYREKGDDQKYLVYVKEAFASDALDIDAKIAFLIEYYDLVPDNEAIRPVAFSLCDILVEQHPKEAKAYSIYGDLLYRSNLFDEALVKYDSAIVHDETVFSVWQQKFFIHSDKGNNEAVVQLAKEAKEIFPNQALIYYFEGFALMQLDESNKAIRSFDKALLKGSSVPSIVAAVYSGLGDAYHGLNNHQASDSCYDKSLQIDPKNANVLNNYSYYLSLRNEHLEKAAEMSRLSNEIVPNQPSYLDTYGWILYMQGKYKEAKIWLEKAMKHGGEVHAEILDHYGDVLFKMGNEKDALNYWMKALERDPGSITLQQKVKSGKL